MKKVFITLSLLVLILCCSCTKENNEAISINVSNYKTAYQLGEALDLNGLKVTLNYSDGSSTVLSKEDYTIDSSSYNSNLWGEYEITITENTHQLQSSFKVMIDTSNYIINWDADDSILANMNKVNDLYKPTFHLTAPYGWMNDPNGFTYYNNQIHMFYQHNPYSSEWDTMHWGHATSTDFIKWTHQPVALAPTQQGIDTVGGCFSGSAIAHNNFLYLFYTGVNEEQEICMAASKDGVYFEKYPNNPVIRFSEVPEGVRKDGFRDPKVFKHNDIFYMIIGAQDKVSGQVLMYKSEDLLNWTYIGQVLETFDKHSSGLHVDGAIECPDFIIVDNQELITGSLMNYPQNETHQNVNSPVYFVGSMNYETGKFGYTDFYDLDYGFDFYAPQTMTLPDGRVIMTAWMQTLGRTFPTHQLGHNWCGAQILPRELTFKDGKLYQNPVREIENYYQNKVTKSELSVSNSETIEGISGNKIDLTLTLDCTNSQKGGLKVLEQGNEYTSIYYDKALGSIVINRENSGNKITGSEQNASYRLAKIDCDVVKLRIIIDVSSIEIFINDGEKVMTSVVYPINSGENITFFSEGGTTNFTNITKYDVIVD